MYKVFAGSYYYPLGGMKDLQYSGTLENCWKFLAGKGFDWWQITNSNFSVKFSSDNYEKENKK